MKKIKCLILVVSLGFFFCGTAWAADNVLQPNKSQYTIPTSAPSFTPVSKAGVIIPSIFSQLKVEYKRARLISGALTDGRTINSAAPVVANQAADIDKNSTVTAKESSTFTPKLGDLTGDGKQNSGNSPVPEPIKSTEVTSTPTPVPTLNGAISSAATVNPEPQVPEPVYHALPVLDVTEPVTPAPEPTSTANGSLTSTTPAPVTPRWSSVIKADDGKLYWLDASKGNPQSGMSYAQIPIPLTPEEIKSYGEWKAGANGQLFKLNPIFGFIGLLKNISFTAPPTTPLPSNNPISSIPTAPLPEDPIDSIPAEDPYAYLYPAPTPQPDAIRVGDVTGDGRMDNADVLMIKQYLVGTTQLTRDQLLAADLNSDGKVDSADALWIAKFIEGNVGQHPTPPDPIGLRAGDLTGDGTINDADLLIVKKYLVGTSKLTPAQLLAADIDKDGKVNSADALWIAKIIVGNVTPPPPEGYAPLRAGDLTGDGKIDSADLMIVKKYLARTRQLTPAQLLAADLDCDGQVTAVDATLLAKILVR